MSSSPCYSDGTIYIGSTTPGAPVQGHVYSLNANSGQQNWAFNTTESINFSSPTFGNGVVFVGGAKASANPDHNLYAINGSFGNLLWQFAAGGDINSGPAYSDGLIYFGCQDYNLYALDASGNQKWAFSTGAPFIIQARQWQMESCIYPVATATCTR
jgi:outer membrane protein assembly factor BamB